MTKKVTLLPEQVEAYKQELKRLYVQISELKSDKKNMTFNKVCNGNYNSPSNESLDCSLLMDLSRIATRIKEVEELLGSANVLNNEIVMNDVVTIGSTFIIDTDFAKDITFTLVQVGGDPVKGLISIESPIGAAVVNKSVGESFSYSMPNKNIVNGVVKSILNNENTIANEKQYVATKK